MTFKTAAMLFFGVIATTAHSTDSYFVNQRKEASMLITGIVNINPDGSVKDYALDHPEKLSQPVKDIVKQNAERWKFQFASAQTTIVSEKMSLRLVAHMLDDQHASIRVVGTTFDYSQVPAGEGMSYAKPPHFNFPQDALKAHVWGTVYVLLRVGRDGSVQDASAEQVNLGNFAPSADMARYRKYLADAAVKDAKRTTFTVPTKGIDAEGPDWLVRIPVNYWPDGQSAGNDYGTWSVYVPGPRMSIPWLEHPELAADAPDTVPDGALHTLGGQPRLSTDSSGS